MKVSRSVVLAALNRSGIPPKGDARKHLGQDPYGYDYLDYWLVNDKAELEIKNLSQLGMYR